MIKASNLLPHPMLSLLLILMWLFLNDSFAPGHLLLGAALGMLIPLFTQRFWPDTVRMGRPLLALRFIGMVIRDIIVANFVVAKVVLGPQKDLQPRFVKVPIELDSHFAITLLVNVVSLTPGTLCAGIDEEKKYILVHALHAQDPEHLVEQIKHRYESPIKEIFS